jgi:hypothetical protein
MYEEDECITMFLTRPGQRIEISFYENDVLYSEFDGSEELLDNLDELLAKLK